MGSSLGSLSPTARAKWAWPLASTIPSGKSLPLSQGREEQCEGHSSEVQGSGPNSAFCTWPASPPPASPPQPASHPSTILPVAQASQKPGAALNPSLTPTSCEPCLQKHAVPIHQAVSRWHQDPQGPLCTALPAATLPRDSPQRLPTARRIRPHLLHGSTPSALPTSPGPALALSPSLPPSRHVALFLPLSHTGLTPISGTGAVSGPGPPTSQVHLVSDPEILPPSSVHAFLGFTGLTALPLSAAVGRVPVLSLGVPSSCPTVVSGLPSVTGSITRMLPAQTRPRPAQLPGHLLHQDLPQTLPNPAPSCKLSPEP